MRRAFPPLVLLAAAACAHAPRPGVAGPADALRCEDAARFLAAHPPDPPPLDGVRLLATAPLSYAATGVAYGAEATAVVGAGVAAGAVVCSPLLALEVALHGSGDASGECFVYVAAGLASGLWLPGAGSGVWRATRAWRCPDLTRLSREVRAIARCHARRGAPGDLEQARAHLAWLREAPPIRTCLPDGERRAIDRALAELEPAPAGENRDDEQRTGAGTRRSP